jgi:nitroreductase
MNLKQAIFARRAIRNFTSEAVGRAALCRLIDAAIQAPTAVNSQALAFSVIEHRSVMARISDGSKTLLREAPPAGLSADHLQRFLLPEFNIFYNAPALIVISSTVQDHWSVVNCTLAAENLMLAACAAGFGTCWIGLAEAWLQTPEGKILLDLPADCLPVAPIIVGHPAAPAPPVPRREPEIHWI